MAIYRDATGRFISNPHLPEQHLTVGEIIDAIEKNGYKQLFGKWQSRKDGQIFGGCAMGQGAANLGIGYRAVNNALDRIQKDGMRLAERIITLNDREQMPVPEIARKVREEYRSVLNTKTSLIRRTE